MTDTIHKIMGMRVAANQKISPGNFYVSQTVVHVNPSEVETVARKMEYRRIANKIWHDNHPDVMAFIGEKRPK